MEDRTAYHNAIQDWTTRRLADVNPDRSQLQKAVQESIDHMNNLGPVDQAILMTLQAESFVRGYSSNPVYKSYASILADEVERLRKLIK